MPLRFVLDEHFRGILWDIIRRHNALGRNIIDAVRVGDPRELPLGTTDQEILLWAEREGRILITEDRSTMPVYLAAHLLAGRHSPGVITPRPGTALTHFLDLLLLVADASEPEEWEDQHRYLP